MAYVGQGIKNGTFSVLDTSGNTYNGSNVTFDLGTQVGSPAQLLVSHDGVIQKPVTDYTIATGGTQITFTTAPASGASIFITEISGAVGAPMNRDLNGDELILDADADTSITADTDDQIDIRIAGADDFSFTANTFTAAAGSSISSPDYSGGAVFNESSADVDFRVESNSNTHMLFVDGGNNMVNVGADGGGQILNVVGSSSTTYEQAITHAIALAMPGIELQNTNTTDGIGNCISFIDSDSKINAAIVGVHDDHGTNGDGYLGFCTRTADSGADTANERMRITNGGIVAINNAGLGSTGVLHVKGKSSAQACIIQNTSDGQTGISFRNGSNSEVGTIVMSASATAFNTSSDYRLKENLNYDFDATTRLKQLKPVRFNFKVDKDKDGKVTKTVDGFLAHEVSSIIPEAITGTKDKVDSESNPVYQGIDQSKLVPLLVKTIQELEARIKTLEDA